MVVGRITCVASALLLFAVPARAEQIAIDIPNVALQSAESLEFGIASITGRRNSGPQPLEFAAGRVGVLGGKKLRAFDEHEELCIDFIAPVALDEIVFDLEHGEFPLGNIGSVQLLATTIDGVLLETSLLLFGSYNSFGGADVFPSAASIVRLQVSTHDDVEASLVSMVVSPEGFAPGQRLQWKLAPGGFQQDAIFVGIPGMTLTLAFDDVAPGSALAATVIADATDTPIQFFTIAKNTKRKIKLNASGVHRLRIADLSGFGASFSITTGRKLPKSFAKSKVTVAPAFGQKLGLVPLALLPGTEFTVVAAPKKPFSGQVGIDVVDATGASLTGVTIAPLLGVPVSTATQTSAVGGAHEIRILGFTTSVERVKVTLTRTAPVVAPIEISIG